MTEWYKKESQNMNYSSCKIPLFHLIINKFCKIFGEFL